MQPNPSLPGKRHTDEYTMQASLIEFRDRFKEKHPGLQKLVSIPNGAFMPVPTRIRMVATGLTAGVWDLVLFHPITIDEEPVPYVSPCMFLDFKVGTETLTKEQVVWGRLMEADGCECIVVRSWVQGARLVVDRLGIQCPMIEAVLKPQGKEATAPSVPGSGRGRKGGTK